MNLCPKYNVYIMFLTNSQSLSNSTDRDKMIYNKLVIEKLQLFRTVGRPKILPLWNLPNISLCRGFVGWNKLDSDSPQNSEKK